MIPTVQVLEPMPHPLLSGLFPSGLLLFGLLLLALPSAASATPNELHGTVIAVIDGDTIRLRTSGGNRQRIKLHAIVAPRHHHDSATILRDWILQQPVRVVWESRDRYRRIVGTLYLDQREINLELVAAGLAWFFHPGDYPDAMRERYQQAEAEARSNQLGLWAEPAQLPPWEGYQRP